MISVYVDPSSYVYLDNVLFSKDAKYNRDNSLLGWRTLKEYCALHGMSLNTIDLRNAKTADAEDIYVSFDYKFLPRRLYWKLKNRAYSIRQLADSPRFAKKILFQFEPPNVMPEMRYLANHALRVYDKVFFAWKTDNPRIRRFLFYQIGGGIVPNLWEKKDRKFLTLINSNRKVLFRHKELLTERIRALLHFAKTDDIDLYGFGWNEHPLFPYWFEKHAIQKIYKGSVGNKHEKLSEYAFALAFENCELPGYITEKLFDCLYTGTVPIYLGAPDVEMYIPKDCFVDMRKFANYKELEKFLHSLNQEQIEKYKENGRRFLESEQYKPFTKEYFAKTFLEACIR